MGVLRDPPAGVVDREGARELSGPPALVSAPCTALSSRGEGESSGPATQPGQAFRVPEPRLFAAPSAALALLPFCVGTSGSDLCVRDTRVSCYLLAGAAPHQSLSKSFFWTHCSADSSCDPENPSVCPSFQPAPRPPAHPCVHSFPGHLTRCRVLRRALGRHKGQNSRRVLSPRPSQCPAAMGYLTASALS